MSNPMLWHVISAESCRNVARDLFPHDNGVQLSIRLPYLPQTNNLAQGLIYSRRLRRRRSWLCSRSPPNNDCSDTWRLCMFRGDAYSQYCSRFPLLTEPSTEKKISRLWLKL
ncbi:hypothetical protein KSP40_PGU009565 [Platanthera guangdongensis]|uniref:Transposase n=1 Tax=Platanthera guangdongensis TaxID=2320717 RepID=A0ABR2MBN1_9ASPA